MATLEKSSMETTKEIRGNELPPSLRKRFNVRERDYLTVTVKVHDKDEYDVENIWETMIEGVREAVEFKKNGGKFQDAEEFLKSL